MSSSSFPILRVPLLVQQKVLTHVELFDLISLSFCSQKTRLLVESERVSLNDLTFRFYEPHAMQIEVNTKYTMSCSRNPKKTKETFLQMSWKNSDQKIMLFNSTETIDCLKERLIKHLMETFRRAKTITVDDRQLLMRNNPIWKYTKTIDDLLISSNDSNMEEEDIKYVFEELTVNDILNINIPVVDGFRFSGGFLQKTVTIHYAQWVEFDAILNSISRFIALFNIKHPAATQFNIFLKLWMSMEKMTNLENFFISGPCSSTFSEQMFLTEILEGIVCERIGPNYARVRRIDGKIAEFRIHNIGCFHFYVVY